MVTEPTTPTLTVRALTADDLTDILELDSTAFGQDVPDDFLHEMIVPELEPDRFVGARDPDAGNRLVASACILSKQLTFPGGSVHPVAGVSWVAVRPGWRRRGLLRGMMTAQLHELHVGGEPVAILTASEAALYGRFGYGQAIDRLGLRLSHGAAFRPDVPVETVIDAHPDQAHELVRGIYERVAPTRPGNLARPDAIWALRFSDHEVVRRGASKKHFGLHPDGYVAYRIKPEWSERGANFALQIDEICAATPVAFASLWRFLLDLDLTREISYGNGWVDDPIQDLLLDPRSMTVSRRDHVWLRLVDLDRAVGLRSFGAPATVVVEITDSFCPWNQGTWAFELGADGSEVTRTDAEAQVRLDIRELGAVLMGGIPLGRMVTAGRVTGEPAALRALGTALGTPVAPWCPEGF